MNKNLLRARMKPWCWWFFGGGLLLFLLVSGRLGVELPVGGGYRRVERYPPLVYLPQVVPPPRINAGAAILVEAVSGMILYAKNEHVRKAPASTTKIATAIVAWKKATPRCGDGEPEGSPDRWFQPLAESGRKDRPGRTTGRGYVTFGQ